MAITSNDTAPQHRPRPLPLFLELLRSETQNDPERARAALAGLRTYQNAPRPPRPDDMPVVARAGRVSIRDYGGAGPDVLFVPSLINPSYVLDLREDNSMLRWLSRNGIRPLLLDWGEATEEIRDISISGYIEHYLLPLIDGFDIPPALVGYCLGGTMALAAAALRPIPRLGLIATPWHFARYPVTAHQAMAELWAHSSTTADQLGLMPLEVLQTAFWRLDPARTISKFENFSRIPGGDPATADYVAVEDWANCGAPLTFAAAQELIEEFFCSDRPSSGHWHIGGQRIAPEAIATPILNIISLVDRITPAATAFEAGERLELRQGHVGMVVGRNARARLWEPLVAWLSQTQNC